VICFSKSNHRPSFLTHRSSLFLNPVEAEAEMERLGEPHADLFRHVNNVRFIRWAETARIRYAESLDLPKGQIQGMMVCLTSLSLSRLCPY
jgi:hypothetical protein